MTSHSLSGPATGPITVPYDSRWAVPAWSCSFWLKLPSGSNITKPGLFATSLAGSATTAGFDAELYGSTLYFTVNGNQSGAGAMGDGAWHHFAAAFDATDLRLYLDGALVGSAHTGLGAMTWGTGDLVMAAFDDAGALFKGGRLYTRKLSAADVSTLYSGADVATGLLADFQCNEGTGSTVTDSVSGLVGTATGTIVWSTDVPSQNPDAPAATPTPTPTAAARRRRQISPARRARIIASFRLPPRQS